jgi:hypothetical protein
MSMNAGCVLGDDGDLFPSDGIDDAEAGVTLIHNQKGLSAGGALKTESRDENTQRRRLSHGQHYSRFWSQLWSRLWAEWAVSP